MPNDVPDWVRVMLAQLVGRASAFTPLGDTTTPSPAPDSVTEQVAGGVPNGLSGVLASLKVLTTFTLVKAGAPLLGTGTAVNPLYGQNTTSGNQAVAFVTARPGGTEPTTAAAGWVKVKSVQGVAGWQAIWCQPNLGASEAPPQFTGGGAGSILMGALLIEFSGGVTSSPTDSTGSGSAISGSLSITNAGADAAFGDLVLLCSAWSFANPSTGVTFSEAFNNGAAAVQAASINADHDIVGLRYVFTFAIVPAVTVSQPLGIANWAYDSVATSAPSLGVAPSVVLAATSGKAYTLAALIASLAVTTAAGDLQFVQVLDGASVVWQLLLGATGVIDATDRVALTGLAIKGTIGSSMTVKFFSIGANSRGTVAVGAYLR